ncbi:MAG: chromate transporter [Solobacterium sp.]|nr:chromate transporter [Solobacterium sp.]
MNTFLLMCLEFFKTGLFAVGGGLATIPFLKEIAMKYGWFTIETLTTMIAVSESTPGPIGVNMSTYVGYTMFGIPGAIGATLSLVAPSVIIICAIAKLLKSFKDSPIVQGIFNGLRPAVVGFILSAIISIYLNSLFHVEAYGNWTQFFNWKAILLFCGLLGFSYWKPKLHPIVMIAIAATIGIVFQL